MCCSAIDRSADTRAHTHPHSHAYPYPYTHIKPVKSLGQNFLTDEGVLSRIAQNARISENDLVIEVGAGAGALTCLLAERAAQVVAVEIDRRLMPVLAARMSLYGNVELVNADILATDISSLADGKASGSGRPPWSGPVKVVANLPYYITAPIVMKFLEDRFRVCSMVLMVQREVAGRMVALPGTPEYGAFTLAVNFYSAPERLFDVPPECFTPRPEVHSTVIRLDMLDAPPVEVKNRELFFKTVRASFGQRRKTIINALSNSGYFKGDKDHIRQMLKNTGIDENCRGETLSILQFANLSNAFFME